MNHNTPINFTHRLRITRPYDRTTRQNQQLAQIESALESDRGRIINSASVRRLQQKTQVFPLERNAAVRSRLTHSLEVQQNGRYIVKTIFKKMGERVSAFGLEGCQGVVESLVEMACLMHDIGNPPFGHFGEAAISQWFQQNINHWPVFERTKNRSLADQMKTDLQQFEGNAQAIRLTFTLQQMNLTYAQSASILKYTRCATESRPNAGHDLAYLQKKPGFYLSEAPFVAAMCQELQIQTGHRSPFTYLMEAADDIAYCLADLEDAVEKGILKLHDLTQLLREQYHAQGGDADAENILSFNGRMNTFNQVLEQALAASKRDRINHNHEFFVKLRINLIHHLVDHAANRFIDNLEAVYLGNLNQALLEDGSVATTIIQTFKWVGLKHVFNHQEVQDLELQGHRILTGLLDIYGGLLSMSQPSFKQLVLDDNSALGYQKLLLNRIDKKITKAYLQASDAHAEEQDLWEFYARCRLLQDHVSAMTDHSALDEYQLLTVSA